MQGLGTLVEHLDLALAWLAYGLIHSLFAADTVKRLAAERFALAGPGYRLAYNLSAMVLLVPVVWLLLDHPGTLLWDPGSALRFAFDLVALAGVLALFLAGPGYDLREFLGIGKREAAQPALRISRWHCYVRHPWYTVALLIIWTREMYAAWLVSALCITAYFVIGAWFEEQKLERCFGEPYRRYRSRVPGLLPFRGRALSNPEAAEIEHAARQ